MCELPVISIVTPCFNAESFLENAIESILSQEYPRLEYYIIDGGSTDRSVEIIKKYENYLSGWSSEADGGMYHALNKGFALTSGEIMTWLNADDLMLPHALATVADVFTQLPTVEWILGLPCSFDRRGSLVYVCPQLPKWSKFRYLMGDFKWVQQEGTFWHRSLWQRSGSTLDESFKYAGDLELWSRFFENAELHSLSIPLAGMRVLGKGQLSHDHWLDYLTEARKAIEAMQSRANLQDHKKFKLIERRQRILKFLSKLKILNTGAYFKFFVDPIFAHSCHINYDHKSQRYELRVI